MVMIDKDSLFMNIFGWVGTGLALFFFFSPATLMYNLIIGKIQLKIIPWVLLLANVSNTLFWVVYGILMKKTQVYVANSIGGGVNLIYLCIFLIHLVKKNVGLSILVCFSTVVGCGGTFFVFYEWVDPEVTGKIAMVFNIIMFAAPSQKIVIFYFYLV